MQTLTIPLLKVRGLRALADRQLGAQTNHGLPCFYEYMDKSRCIAGWTFSDETLAEVMHHHKNDAYGIGQLDGIVHFADERTEQVYRVTQVIHDSWAQWRPVETTGFNTGTDDEMAFLSRLDGSIPTEANMKAWLELIQ